MGDGEEVFLVLRLEDLSSSEDMEDRDAMDDLDDVDADLPDLPTSARSRSSSLNSRVPLLAGTLLLVHKISQV